MSTDHQHEENQLPDLERFCEHHGYEITRRYMLSDVSAFNGAHRETLKAMLDDARRGEDRKPRRTEGYVEAWKQRKTAL